MSKIFRVGSYYYNMDNVWRCGLNKLTDYSVLTINNEAIKIFDKATERKAKDIVDTFVGKAKNGK